MWKAGQYVAFSENACGLEPFNTFRAHYRSVPLDPSQSAETPIGEQYFGALADLGSAPTPEMSFDYHLPSIGSILASGGVNGPCDQGRH